MGSYLCYNVCFPKQYSLYRPSIYRSLFMGPMSSGKTQIAISIRSLFISPNISIFNLNTGTLPALSSLLSSFRDVPVVLDEYNNKDINDQMFQYLKQSVYDGEGRQKRKANQGKDIEIEKVLHR